VDLLKANDVAQRLAVSRAWVYEAARTGRIPSVRIGGEDGPLRFVPDDIDQWLADARAEWSPAPRRSRTTADAGDRRSRSQSRRRPRSVSKAAEQQSLL
jgi:excisionase family DNA binding protein